MGDDPILVSLVTLGLKLPVAHLHCRLGLLGWLGVFFGDRRRFGYLSSDQKAS